MKQKSLCFLLAVCIMLSVLPPMGVFGATSTTSGILLEETFADNKLNVMTTNRATDTTRLKLTTVSDVAGISNAAILAKNHVFINGPFASIDVSKTSAFTTEGPNTVLHVEFDVNLNNYETAATPYAVMLGDGSEYSAVGLCFDPNTRTIKKLSSNANVYNNGIVLSYFKEFEPTAVSYEFNRWYRMKLVVKVTNDTGYARKYDLYIDGVKVVEDEPFYQSESAAISDIKFWCNSGGSANNKDTMAVANVSVFLEKQDVGVPAPADRSALIAAIRNLNKTIAEYNYTDSDVQTAITNAMTVYNSTPVGGAASTYQAAVDQQTQIINDWINTIKSGTETCEDVTASVPPGMVPLNTTVILSTATEGATIYYTTDGSDPATSSTRIQYTGPITINRNMIIKAIAEKPGASSSNVTEFVYSVPKSAQDYGYIFTEDFENAVLSISEGTFGKLTVTKDASRIASETISSVPDINKTLKISKPFATVTAKLESENQKTYVTSQDAYPIEGPNTKLYVDFDINLQNKYESDGTLYHNTVNLRLGDGTAYSLSIRANPSNLKIEYSVDNEATWRDFGSGFTYELNKWYRMRIVMNVTDSSGFKGTFDFYVNGVKIGSDIPYSAAADFVNTFTIATPTGSDSVGHSKSYVDNIVLYKQSDLYSVGAPADNGLFIATIREAKELLDKIELIGEENYDAEALAVLREEYDLALELYAESKYSTYADIQDIVDEEVAYLRSAIDAIGDVEVRYPDGGYQVNETYDDGTPDASYGIGKAYKFESNSAKKEVNLGDKIEGIVVWSGEASHNGVTYNMEREGPSATLIVELDIKFDDLVSSGSTVGLRLTDAYAFDTHKTFPVIIYFNGATREITNQISGNNVKVFEGLEDGKWYRIRSEIYANDANLNPVRKQSLWINGIKVSSNQSLASASYYKFPNINRINIIKTENSNGLGTTVYIDNFSVYKSNINAPMTLNYGGLLKAIRDAEDYLAIGDAPTLRAALTDAIAVCEDENATQESIDAARAALLEVYNNLEESSTPFILEAFRYENSVGERVYVPTDGGVVTGVYVSKVGKYDSDSTLALALYKNNQLMKVKFYTIPSSIARGETACIDTSFELPDSNIEDYVIKAMSIKDLISLKPLGNVLTDSVAVIPEGQKITLYLAGDSTVCDYDDRYFPQAGWGQMLGNYFDNTYIAISNYAAGGRSSKSFINEGRLKAILNNIKKGDYLFIQFTHNDQKPDEALHTDPNTTFKEYLLQYIRGARAKGAYPVLVTPPTRRAFWGEGGTFNGIENLGAYPQAMREVGEAYGVPVVDLTPQWANLVSTLGNEGSKEFYLYIEANDPRFISDPRFANSVYNKNEVTNDQSHFQIYGADVMAGMIVDLIKVLNLPITEYIIQHEPVKPTIPTESLQAINTVPLYETVSVYVPWDDSASVCDFFYKESEGASAPSDWQKAYPAVYDKVNKQFSGSIVGLKEDTQYDIKAVLRTSNGTVYEGITTVRTWTSNPPIAETVLLSHIYDSGMLVLNSGDWHGSEDGWIKIDGQGQTVDAGTLTDYAVYINNAQYVILENIKVKGGKKSGIYIGSNAQNIRIINCDISGWGRTGTLTQFEDGTVAYVDEDGNKINYDAGIVLSNCKKITIERCYIHEPRGTTNAWADTLNNLTWTNSHPMGMCGIYVKATQTVIRYNDIIGNEKHRFNDGIESNGNFNINGGLAADSDVYGNMLAFGQDDGIELDGGARNVRFFKNRITNFYSGISTSANMVGPSYVFNNLVHNLRDSTDTPNLHMKNGGIAYGQGITHIFYNTFFAENGRRDYGIANVNESYNAVSRNNIVVGGQASRYQVGVGATEYENVSDFNYDLLGNWATAGNKGVVDMKAGLVKEPNAIFGMPTFINFEAGDFRLSPSSLGYNAAVNIDGFSGSNMGAFDIDSNGLLPYRPIHVTADKYFVKMKKGTTAYVTLTSYENEDLVFNILKNDSDGYIYIESDQSVISNGGQVTLTINAGSPPASKYEEMFIVKFSNGYSIPIGVRITN